MQQGTGSPQLTLQTHDINPLTLQTHDINLLTLLNHDIMITYSDFGEVGYFLSIDIATVLTIFARV